MIDGDEASWLAAALVPEEEQPYPIPGNWVWVRLGAAVAVNPPKKDVSDLPAATLVTFVPMSAVDETVGEIAEALERPLSEVQKGYTQFVEGDVLFAKITPCMENGNSAVVNATSGGVGYGSTEFHVLRPRAITASLVYRLVRSQEFRDAAKQVMSGAVGQQRVPKVWMEEYPVPLPPPSEQRRLAERLDSLFAKVAEARSLVDEARETFAERRAAILAAACSGRLTEEWREGWDSPKGKHLVDLDRDAVEVPGTWDRSVLSELIEPSRPLCYGVVQPGVDIPGGVPLIRVQDLGSWTIAEDQLRSVSVKVDAEYRRSRVQSGDLLLSIVGTIGRTALVPDGFQGNIARAVARIACGPDIDPSWVNVWLSSAPLQWWLLRASREVARKTLNLSDLSHAPVAVPPLPEQREIVRRVQSLFDLTAAAEQAVAEASEQLEEVTQAILARAFRGKLGTNNPAEPSALNLLGQVATRRVPLPMAPSRKGRGKISPSPLAGEGRGGGMSPRHIPQAILTHMKPGRAYSRSELCVALGLTAAEWTWAIRELKGSGKVVQTGERRGARYALAG